MTRRPVFISYSTDDTAAAEPIRDGLEAASITCWIAPRDIAPGLEYGSQIVAAIEECAVLVLLLSESSNRSRFVLNEVERAVSKDKIVIPVRIHDVRPSRSLEFFVSNAQWIDATQPPLGAHIETLTIAIRRHLATTGSPAQAQSASGALPKLVPPAQLPANRRFHLPVPSTPFVGRTEELAEIVTILADPDCRLLTLAGQGGMGKTRLSLEIAHRILGDATQADGVFFVALENLSGPEQIAPAVAKALDLGGSDQTAPSSTVLTFLADKQLLLVMDNFEHLLDGVVLVGDILASAPGVKVLATSRQTLNLQEEWFHPVGGLDLPQLAGGSQEEKLASSAVQFFAACARRARRGFDVNEEFETVTQLCHLVDGVPLALELAAAWLRTLSCAQVLEELQSSLDLLTTSMRNVPQRHRSMEAVFEQSWRMLDEREQRLLCQLAVFAGGFDWPAVRAVCSSSMATLTQLVSSSWIQVSDDGRYALIPLVRSYLQTRLNDDYARIAGESLDGVRDRHSHYYAAWLYSVPVIERGRDIANLSAGWRHALAHFDDDELSFFIARCLPKLEEWPGLFQDVDKLLTATERRFSVALSRKQEPDHQMEWLGRLADVQIQHAAETNRAGFTHQAEARCRQALETLDRMENSGQSEPKRILVFAVLGWILISQSRLREADEVSTQALVLISMANEDLIWHQIFVLHNLAYSTEEQGRYTEAAAYLDRALEMEPDSFHLITRRGSVCYWVGAYDEAARCFSRAAQYHPTTEMRFSLLQSEVFWARLDAARGNLAAAAHRLLAILSPLKEHSAKLQLVWALQELGRIRLAQDMPDEAECYYLEATQVGEEQQRSKVVAGAWVGLGNVALVRAAYPQAALYFRQALALAWPLGILPEAIMAVMGLAQIEAHQGRPLLATAWLRAAAEHTALPYHIQKEAQALFAATESHEPVAASALEEIVTALLAPTD